MTGEARYAVYFAPNRTDPLWTFGSSVIGYDAASGEDVTLLVPEGWTREDWRAATDEPRRYGFHATLKAPFRLAPGRTETDLVAALEEFGRSRPAPPPVPLSVQLVETFAALVPARASHGLAALEEAALRAFEPFRAPLTPQERERRRPETLTSRQLRSLDAWGYPHVLDDFRFHMTLSGRLPPDRAADTRLALARLAEEAGVPRPVPVDRVCLFRQPAGAPRFAILASVQLSLGTAIDAAAAGSE